MGRESKKDLFVLRKKEVLKKDGKPNCGCSQEQCITFGNDESFQKNIELFPWEKLDYIDVIKKEFNL